MQTVATVLPWSFFGAGVAVLAVALGSSVRMKLSGARLGAVLEAVETRWFGAGSVLLALLVGGAAMTAAGRLTDHSIGIEQAALVVFPLALVAAFAVRRITDKYGHKTAARASGLVLAPAVFGALMSAAG